MAMQKELELTLSHNGQHWLTDTFDAQLYGKDLAALEDQISAAVQINPRFDKEELIKVQLRFDMDVIPKWLHQYHSHYFNYSFTVINQEPD